jgi:hypothetical protein
MTTARKIGVLTIGQAPRADDTAAELFQVLGPGYTITERGALATHGCTWTRPQSGPFICSRERADHVLPTDDARDVDNRHTLSYH